VQRRAADLLEVYSARRELLQERRVALVESQRAGERLAIVLADGLRHRRGDLLRRGDEGHARALPKIDASTTRTRRSVHSPSRLGEVTRDLQTSDYILEGRHCVNISR
jgi:hypothetical protein